MEVMIICGTATSGGGMVLVLDGVGSMIIRGTATSRGGVVWGHM